MDAAVAELERATTLLAELSVSDSSHATWKLDLAGALTSLGNALEKLLTRRTMSVTEMSEAVQKAGYRTSSPNFRTIVNQTLIGNKKVFKRVARGQYTKR